MKRGSICGVLMAALAAFLFATGAAAQPSGRPSASAKPEIVVVYWSSDDCRWCTWWEGGSGLEKSFRASPEFQKIRFHRIKNAALRFDYDDKALYPVELAWLRDRYLAREFKKPFRPGWWIFVDRQLVDQYGGVKYWEEQAFPKIQELVALHHGK